MLMNERRPLSLGDYPAGDPNNADTWRVVDPPHFLRAGFDYEAIKNRRAPVLTDVVVDGMMLKDQAA